MPRITRPATLLALAAAVVAAPAIAATGLQVGPSGKTYASAEVQCAMNPVTGMAPVVHAGLYNPKKSASATVSVDGAPVASVNFVGPDATLWLANGQHTVAVALNARTVDRYAFDATPAGQQLNVCLPDTGGNTVSGDYEYAASQKSYATVVPGCALNPVTGRAQRYVHLFDNGAFVLNVSVNNVPLTQLSATRPRTPVFLAAGLNVISAANGAVSTDNFVRDGGTGSCTLP